MANKVGGLISAGAADTGLLKILIGTEVMTGFCSTGSTFLNKGLSTGLAKGLLTTGAGLASKIDFFSST